MMQNEKNRRDLESKEQKNSLSCTNPGKSRVYLLQTTGSSKISNQQLTSICQWFPGRHNFAPPPLPALLTSTQGWYDSTRDIPGKRTALPKTELETAPRFSAASAQGSVKGVQLFTRSLETTPGEVSLEYPDTKKINTQNPCVCPQSMKINALKRCHAGTGRDGVSHGGRSQSQRNAIIPFGTRNKEKRLPIATGKLGWDFGRIVVPSSTGGSSKNHNRS